MNKKRSIQLLAIIIVLCAVWISVLIFYPRSYGMLPLKQRPGTRYWQLSTGSRIAYTFLPAKNIKNPQPVIYLHGGPGAGITDLEVRILNRLANYGYDVYLYDQVGCGYSSRLKNISDYSAERHERDLHEIVNNIGAQKVILLGQSWGAILSTMYLAKNPDKVYKLVITAPAFIQPENNKYRNLSAPDSLHLRAPMYTNRQANVVTKNMRSRAMEFCLRNFHRKLASDREADQYATYLTDYLNKSMVCDSANAVRAEGTEGYYVHFMTRLTLGDVHDPREALRKLNTPVLIMKAQCDNQPWGFTQEYLDIFSNDTFALIKNAGHNIFIEQPGKYVETIAEFLQRIQK